MRNNVAVSPDLLKFQKVLIKINLKIKFNNRLKGRLVNILIKLLSIVKIKSPILYVK
jgi:hypothetical protein